MKINMNSQAKHVPIKVSKNFEKYLPPGFNVGTLELANRYIIYRSRNHDIIKVMNDNIPHSNSIQWNQKNCSNSFFESLSAEITVLIQPCRLIHIFNRFQRFLQENTRVLKLSRNFRDTMISFHFSRSPRFHIVFLFDVPNYWERISIYSEANSPHPSNQ